MRPLQRFILATLVSAAFAQAQTTPPSVTPMLAEPIQPVPVTAYQVQRYMMERIPKLPAPESPEQWTREEGKLRQHLLNDIAFHGWPREWVESPAAVRRRGRGRKWPRLPVAETAL